MSDRDCQHGQLPRVCDRCADAAEIERLRAEIERLNASRHELQAAGTHPAPCARHCESTAYEIEIRRLCAELAASREREARMREAIDAAANIIGDAPWWADIWATHVGGAQG